MKLILASKSPRRKEILENLGYDFKIVTVDIEETSEKSSPEEIVLDISAKKGIAVKEHLKKAGELTDDTVIISCDTVVIHDGNILGKPNNYKNAVKMLHELSGKRHVVFSGLSVTDYKHTVTKGCSTAVYFDKLSDEQIDEYAKSKEPYDKAGAYGIQGHAGIFVNKIEGCYFNVVGLPVNLLYNMLKEYK